MLPPNSGAPATYDSDELTNYEVGIRTGNESGGFTLDVAAFFLDWEDIQLFQVVNDFGVNANGGTAESKGIEFTATARASDGLSFSLTGAYIDAELTEDTDPDGAGPTPDLVGGFDGDPLPFVPELTLGLSGDYEWSVFGDSTAYVGALVSYTGERTASFADRVDLTDPTSPLRELDSYTTVDLRGGVHARSMVARTVREEPRRRGWHNRLRVAGHSPERRRGPRGDPAAHVRPRTRLAVLTAGRNDGNRVRSP